MRLFWEDSYRKEFDDTILDIIGNKVVLEHTAFYAESGGQSGDTGKINDVSVIDTQYSGSGKTIYHIVDPKDLKFLKKRSKVHGAIDWERRYKIMRHHSALHIVYLAFEVVHGKHKIIGSQVREDKARVDFEYFDEVNLAEMQKVLDEAISKDIPIKVYPSEKDPDYRIWELEGYPTIPCGGTHVHKTGEIGTVSLKRKNLGSQGVRIYCSTENVEELD